MAEVDDHVRRIVRSMFATGVIDDPPQKSVVDVMESFAVSQRIAEKLGRLFPTLDTKPQFAWTGSFGTTSSGLPIIGHLPRHPGIFAVMGYGGNGITFSQIASEIRSALAGRPDRDADLFAFAK